MGILKYIITSEFDLDIGATVTYQYPKSLALRKDILSSYSVPSGAHTRELDWTYFSLRHPLYKSKSIFKKDDQQLKDPDIEQFQDANISVYQYNELIDTYESPKQHTLKIKKETFDEGASYFLEFISDSKVEIKHRINLDLVAQHVQNEEPHPELIKIYLENGKTIGIQFVDSSKLIPFFNLLRKFYITLTASDQFSTPEILHCANLFKTYRDKRLKRGATTFSLSFVVERPFIETVRPIMQSIISEISFKALIILNTKTLKSVTELTESDLNQINKSFEEKVVKYYNLINSIFDNNPDAISLITHQQENLTNTENSVLSTISAMNLPLKRLTDKKVSISINGQNLETKIPTILTKSEVPGSSITLLFDTFGGANLMHIYRALITGKRILILAYDCSMSIACKAVLSIPLLVNQSFNSLQLCYPYCSLYSLSFSSKKSFVAGTTNPIFKVREEWDLFCDISSSEILSKTENANKNDLSIKYDELFVKYLIFGLENIEEGKVKKKELFLRKSFWDYTKLIYENVYHSENSVSFKNSSSLIKNLDNKMYDQIINSFYTFVDFICYSKNTFHEYNKERAKEIVQTEIFRCYDKFWNEKFKDSELNKSYAVLTGGIVNCVEIGCFESFIVDEKEKNEKIIEALKRVENFLGNNENENDIKLALLFKAFNSEKDQLESIAANMFNRNEIVREISISIMKKIVKLIGEANKMKEVGNYVMGNMSLFYCLQFK